MTTALLGELAERITSGSRAWRSRLGSGSGRFLLTQCVRDGALDLSLAPAVDAPQDQEAERTRVRPDDILITIVGDVGRVALVRGDPGECYVSQSVALVRPNGGVDPRYLETYLRSPAHGQAYFEEKQYGVGRGHLLLGHLRDLPVLVPEFEEQSRIVSRIEGQLSMLASAVESLGSARRRMASYWPAALSSTIRQLLEPTIDTERCRPFEFVTSGSRGWARYYSAEGAAFVRMGNVGRSTIDLDGTRIQRVRVPEGVEGKRTRLLAGDLVISITADLGMIGVVPDDLGEAYVNQHLALARVGDDFDPRFVAWYLASPQGQRKLTEKRRGATKAGLGLDDVRSVRVPRPRMERQLEIVETLEAHRTVVDAFEADVGRAERRAVALRMALLSEAIAGRVT